MPLHRPAILGLALFLVLPAANPLRAAENAGKDVRVVNSAAEPVPVTATGTVSLTPGACHGQPQHLRVPGRPALSGSGGVSAST